MHYLHTLKNITYKEPSMTKIYDLSQDLNQDCSFWPFYPPFEVKYIKRKSEHGVNAQYIQTSNHMGTHLDAPRHFVTKGKTIDQIPIEWCYGPGVIVDLSDMLDDVGLFTPEDIENRADVQDGDILFIHTGWHKYSFFSEEADEERYIQRHPGPHFSRSEERRVGKECRFRLSLYIL